MQQPPVLKLIMVGSGGVGKSALTLQFMYDEFIEDYEPTKADSYRKKFNLDGEEAQIDILDTAGQEDYVGIRDNYFRTGEAFLLVYAIDDLEGLEVLRSLREQVLRAKNNDRVPMILVVNKSDLKDDFNKSNIDAGLKFAREWGIPLVETSAKTRHNVDMVFETAARIVRQNQLANIQKPKAVANKKQRKRCVIL